MGLPATKRPNSEPLSLTRPSVSDIILQQNRSNTSNEVTHISDSEEDIALKYSLNPNDTRLLLSAPDTKPYSVQGSASVPTSVPSLVPASAPAEIPTYQTNRTNSTVMQEVIAGNDGMEVGDALQLIHRAHATESMSSTLSNDNFHHTDFAVGGEEEDAIGFCDGDCFETSSQNNAKLRQLENLEFINFSNRGAMNNFLGNENDHVITTRLNDEENQGEKLYYNEAVIAEDGPRLCRENMSTPGKGELTDPMQVRIASSGSDYKSELEENIEGSTESTKELNKLNVLEDIANSRIPDPDYKEESPVNCKESEIKGCSTPIEEVVQLTTRLPKVETGLIPKHKASATVNKGEDQMVKYPADRKHELSLGALTIKSWEVVEEQPTQKDDIRVSRNGSECRSQSPATSVATSVATYEPQYDEYPPSVLLISTAYEEEAPADRSDHKSTAKSRLARETHDKPSSLTNKVVSDKVALNNSAKTSLPVKFNDKENLQVRRKIISRKRLAPKPLAALCSQNLRPRVGLSKKVRIESLHENIKRQKKAGPSSS